MPDAVGDNEKEIEELTAALFETTPKKRGRKPGATGAAKNPGVAGVAGVDKMPVKAPAAKAKTAGKTTKAAKNGKKTTGAKKKTGVNGAKKASKATKPTQAKQPLAPKTPKQMTIADMVAKRKTVWQEKHDIEYDSQLVKAAAVKVLSTPELSREIREKPYLLIELCFQIVDKTPKTVPFFFNDVQLDFLGKFEQLGTGKPYFILKGRQQGFTTLITAMQLAYAITRKNFSGFTLADRSDNTRAIFNDKARMVYERLPEELKPTERYNSTNELFFDKLNSSWRAATATKEVGRSRTLQFVHFSEIAFYECSLSDMQAGIGAALTADSVRVYETTANGFNEAKDLWDSGTCNNIFFEWWRSSEYRSTEYEYITKADAWLQQRIKVLEQYGLEREQIAWYCKTYDGYIDKSKIKQEYPCTPEEAFISSGDSVFDKEIIINQLALASRLSPVKVGSFVYDKVCIPVKDGQGNVLDNDWEIHNIKFVESRDGYITIHEEPRTKTDKDGTVVSMCPYVIGGDTAGLGIDYFTAKVIDNTDGRTVATLHKQRIDEDLYAEQMYCLGKYYNDALIGIETNYSRQPMRLLQQKYSYPNLYRRERIDALTDKVETAIGFETTRATKRVIIQNLVALMRDTPSIEVDMETLREMTTFVRKENGSTEAVDGAHDDLVMALAITHFIAGQQSKQWITVKPPDDDIIERLFGKPQEQTGHFMDWEDF